MSRFKKSMVGAVVVALALVLLPQGCRWCYVYQADRAIAPVVKAIENYRVKSGHLPAQLEDLGADAKSLKLESLSDVGRVWSIYYQLETNGTYLVEFNHAEYDVYYLNGKRQRVEFNWWR
jgi:hypothetical protein